MAFPFFRFIKRRSLHNEIIEATQRLDALNDLPEQNQLNDLDRKLIHESRSILLLKCRCDTTTLKFLTDLDGFSLGDLKLLAPLIKANKNNGSLTFSWRPYFFAAFTIVVIPTLIFIPFIYMLCLEKTSPDLLGTINFYLPITALIFVCAAGIAIGIKEMLYVCTAVSIFKKKIPKKLKAQYGLY